jgi:hypothetical protein
MTAVVLVDDDDAVLRNGVRVRREARSDFGFVAGAASGREAVRLVLQPQVSGSSQPGQALQHRSGNSARNTRQEKTPARLHQVSTIAPTEAVVSSRCVERRCRCLPS